MWDVWHQGSITFVETFHETISLPLILGRQLTMWSFIMPPLPGSPSKTTLGLFLQGGYHPVLCKMGFEFVKTLLDPNAWVLACEFGNRVQPIWTHCRSAFSNHQRTPPNHPRTSWWLFGSELLFPWSWSKISAPPDPIKYFKLCQRHYGSRCWLLWPVILAW